MEKDKKCCHHECTHDHHCHHDHKTNKCDHSHGSSCCSHGCSKHIVVCPLCRKGAIEVPLETVQTLTQTKEIG